MIIRVEIPKYALSGPLGTVDDVIPTLVFVLSALMFEADAFSPSLDDCVKPNDFKWCKAWVCHKVRVRFKHNKKQYKIKLDGASNRRQAEKKALWTSIAA